MNVILQILKSQSTNHLKILCKNAGGKISMMARIAIYLPESKKKVLLRTLFNLYLTIVLSMLDT